MVFLDPHVLATGYMAMRLYRPWTKEEFAILDDLFPKGGTRLVAEALPHRSDTAIQKAAFNRSLQVVDRHKIGHRFTRWDAEKTERLRVAYTAGGIVAARKEFPDVSPGALAAKASQCGFRATPAKPPSPTRSQPVEEKKPAALPDPKPRAIIVEGECDRGDCEMLRRRLLHLCSQYAVEFGRTPAAIRRAIVDLAKRDFAPDSLQRLRVDGNEIPT
jgi:hypothetical protein